LDWNINDQNDTWDGFTGLLFVQDFTDASAGPVPGNPNVSGVVTGLNMGPAYQFAVGVDDCTGVGGCFPDNEDQLRLGELSVSVPGIVPLPAAAWLMLAGLGGLGLMSRRKAKAA
jgi:hypothetical protein